MDGQEEKLFGAFNAHSIPFNAVIDKEGKVRYAAVAGRGEFDKMLKILAELTK